MIGPVFCSTLGLFTSHHMNFFGVDDLGKNAYIHIHRKRSRKTTDNEYRQTYLALVRREVVLGPRLTDSCGKKAAKTHSGLHGV